MVQTGLWGQGCVGTRSSLLQRVQAAQGPWGSLPAGSVAVILLRDRGASLGAWHSLQGNTATGGAHNYVSVQFSSVQSLSRVRLSETP